MPSAIDPNTVATTQPPATSPTTSGVRAVFTAIKALFVIAAAEITQLMADVLAAQGDADAAQADATSALDETSALDGRVTTLEGGAAALKTTGDPVDVESAAPGVAGDVLTLTDAEHATWQAPGGGGGYCWTIAADIPVSVDGGPADVVIYNANLPAKGILVGGIYSNTGGMGGATATVRDAAGGGGNALSMNINSAMVATNTPFFSFGTPSIPAGGSVYLRCSVRSSFRGTLFMIWAPVAP